MSTKVSFCTYDDELEHEHTVLGMAIPPRRPQRSTRSLLIRAMLECGPFLSAFDAGMCDE